MQLYHKNIQISSRMFYSYMRPVITGLILLPTGLIHIGFYLTNCTTEDQEDLIFNIIQYQL